MSVDSSQPPFSGASNKTKPERKSLWELFDNIFKFLEAIAFILWMTHEFVFDTHKIILFLAIALGLSGPIYILAHKILVKGRWVIFSWLSYVVCIVLIFENRQTENRAHLKLSLIVGGFENHMIDFTNDFLHPREQPAGSDFSKLKYDDVKGVLLLPITKEHPGETLKFVVKNDSKVPAEAVELAFMFPQRIRCYGGDGWLPGDPQLDGMSGNMFRCVSPLLLGDGQETSDLVITNLSPWITKPPTMPFFVIVIKAKDVAPVSFYFWMMFGTDIKQPDITSDVILHRLPSS